MKVDVFFDYSCPFCYRGHLYLKELMKSFDTIKLNWCPCEAHPHQLPNLPMQALFFLLEQGGDVWAFHDEVYEALFERNRQLTDQDVILDCAEAANVDVGQLKEALLENCYYDQQTKANQYAYEQNKVWAVPSFVCGDLRLDSVEGVGITKEQLQEFLEKCK